MATHSSILAWRIPRTEEPGRLQSTESHRVGHDWSDLTHIYCIYPPWMWCYPGWEGPSSRGCSPHSSPGRGAWRQAPGFLWSPCLLQFLQNPSPSYLLHPQRSEPSSALFRKPRSSLESTLSSPPPNQYKVRTVAGAGGVITVFHAVSSFHVTAHFIPIYEGIWGGIKQLTQVLLIQESVGSALGPVCLAPKPTFFATWVVPRPSLQSIKRGNRRVSTWTGESRLTAADCFLWLLLAVFTRSMQVPVGCIYMGLEGSFRHYIFSISGYSAHNRKTDKGPVNFNLMVPKSQTGPTPSLQLPTTGTPNPYIQSHNAETDLGSWFRWVVLFLSFWFFFFFLLSLAIYIHMGINKLFFLWKKQSSYGKAHVGCGGFLRAWGFAIKPRESVKVSEWSRSVVFGYLRPHGL